MACEGGNMRTQDELKSRLAELEKTESYSITTDY